MGAPSKPRRNHAIVMGGSIGGLLAARVLSDHYGEVTIIERDPLISDARQRPGVPQGRHTHGLLAGGGNVLDRLFPGFSRALVHDGALPVDIVRDVRWFFEGGCLRQVPSDLRGLAMTRPFLETAIRNRVLAIANVRTRDQVVVEGLAVNGSRVEGVRAAGGVIAADLTVDATGRRSRTPEWLEKFGYHKPAEEAVKVDLGYTTRFFRRSPSHLGGDLAAIIAPTPAGKRGGVMVAQEGDRWSVTLIGHFGDYAPEDLAGYLEFARTIPSPCLYEIVRDAEPLGEAASYRFPASVRRRYETLTRFPEGYLVFGDAMSSFNPIYGQGMSVAALEALELEKTLAAGEDDLSRGFFRRAAKVVDIPWSIAVGNDLRMPETAGPRSAAVRLVNSYISRLHRAAHSDAVLSLAFQRVANLAAPPPTIMHPRIALRVLWQRLKPSHRAVEAENTRAAAQ